MDFSTVSANLKTRGFSVSEFADAAAAAAYLNREIDGVTVGFGGSVTLAEMGMYDLLAAHNTVFSHWNPSMDRDAVLRGAQSADVYLLSVNGLSETGEIINIDGTCNRTSALQFGHKKVYFVVGENKLAPDYDAALFRARNVAAPMNAKRLSVKTPCAVAGDKCYNCNSPDRICRSLSVLWEKPRHGDFEVVLIHQRLGY